MAINEYSERILRISPELKKWLEIYLPTVPGLSDDAQCEFEAVINLKEGTSFDFIAYDNNTEIRFEIKFTEDGFGKVKKTANQDQVVLIFKSIKRYINRGLTNL